MFSNVNTDGVPHPYRILILVNSYQKVFLPPTSRTAALLFWGAWFLARKRKKSTLNSGKKGSCNEIVNWYYLTEIVKMYSKLEIVQYIRWGRFVSAEVAVGWMEYCSFLSSDERAIQCHYRSLPWPSDSNRTHVETKIKLDIIKNRWIERRSLWKFLVNHALHESDCQKKDTWDSPKDEWFQMDIALKLCDSCINHCQRTLIAWQYHSPYSESWRSARVLQDRLETNDVGNWKLRLWFHKRHQSNNKEAKPQSGCGSPIKHEALLGVTSRCWHLGYGALWFRLWERIS